MNHEFTKRLGAWLALPPAERDPAEGALLLLKLRGNRLQYAAIMANPDKYADYLDYELQKHYNFRVADLTLAEVKEMKSEVAEKVEKLAITEAPESAGEDAATFAGYGRRPDHDSLPEAARKAYTDNLEVRRKMQQLHLQIRTKYNELTNCTASDVYALVRELLRYEKIYEKNWSIYDNAAPEPQTPAE